MPTWWPRDFFRLEPVRPQGRRFSTSACSRLLACRATRTDQAGRFAWFCPKAANASLGVQHPRYIAQGAGVKPDARTLDPIVMEPAGTIAGQGRRWSDWPACTPCIARGAAYRGPSRILGGWGEARRMIRDALLSRAWSQGSITFSSKKRLAVLGRRPRPWRACASAAGRARPLS